MIPDKNLFVIVNIYNNYYGQWPNMVKSNAMNFWYKPAHFLRRS